MCEISQQEGLIVALSEYAKKLIFKKLLKFSIRVPIMAKPVFDYLSGIGESTGIDINESEVPDGLLKIIVRKVGESCMHAVFCCC